MADTGDLKSPALTGVRVRAPPSAQALKYKRFRAFLMQKKTAPKGRRGDYFGDYSAFFSTFSSAAVAFSLASRKA